MKTREEILTEERLRYVRKCRNEIREDAFFEIEEKIGREKTEELLLKYGFEKGFRKYPHDEKSLLAVRKEAQRLILGK